MTKALLLRLLIAVLVALPFALAHAGPPAGHWEGAIEVPSSPIEIAIDLEKGDAGWAGDIDIPAQGMSGFPLSEIAVDGTNVSFALSGIPGEPVFKGTLEEDGTVLAGSFHQGGATMPFRLERTGDAVVAAASAAEPVPAELAEVLSGRWEGTLKVPGRSMRLAFVVAADEEGRLSATFDSVDEGRTGMPVTRVTVDGETLRAEIAYAGAVYEGTLNEGRTALAGTWTQGGGALPLDLHKGGIPEEPFPAAEPESVGIPQRAIDLLAERAQAMVEAEEIVGGELVVIKDRRTVFRESFGFKDREAGKRLENDAVYCVRSMTKPFVGTAIQMLIDEGKLKLDTPVREILPFFDGPQTGKITVEHLLAHRGGFPFTTIGKPLSEYPDLAAVAAEAAATELLFEPGARYEYSDAGSDTLGAIVAAVTGTPVEQFIQERILDPLGMSDTVTLLAEGDEMLARIPSAYSGGTGSWSKHWDPAEDRPIFSIFLTSQSLYSTTTDYARFLAFWMDGGKVGDERLLSPEAVKRALKPVSRVTNYPKGLADLDVWYGQQWLIHAKDEKAVVFGHNGSDGTYAWAWPEQELIVLFFTQSRGSPAGIGLEGALQAALVDQALDDPALAVRSAGAEALEQLAGLYWDETNVAAYYVISPRKGGLKLERPGGAQMIFKAGEAPDRFVHEARPGIALEFLRDEDGAVTAMKTLFGDRVETDPLHVPDEELPSAEEVIALVRKAHGTDKLSELGAVRMTGTIQMETRNLEGSITNVFDAERLRADIDLGVGKQTMVVNGHQAWSRNAITGVEELDGSLREQVLLDRLAVRFGDWTEHYEEVEVLKRVTRDDGRSILMVRVVPREAPGATMFVDEQSGMLVRMESLVQVPGMGIIGLRTDFRDYRDVGGVQLAFRQVATYATPLIGKVVTQFEEASTGVDVAAETFSAPKPIEEN